MTEKLQNTTIIKGWQSSDDYKALVRCRFPDWAGSGREEIGVLEPHYLFNRR